MKWIFLIIFIFLNITGLVAYMMSLVNGKLKNEACISLLAVVLIKLNKYGCVFTIDK